MGLLWSTQATMRRRTKNIQLFTMGSVILTGCAPDAPDDRFVYKQHRECVADWGEQNCPPVPVQGTGFGSSQYFYGPHYQRFINLPSGHSVWTGTATAPTRSPVDGHSLGARAVPVSRGGFGSSALRFLGSGG